MAKKKQKDVAGDIEWYLISIDRLKQIGLVLVLLILAGVGYWFWSHQPDPHSAAVRAIADARTALNEFAASKEFNEHRPDYDRAQRKLEDANSLLNAQKFLESQGAAIECQTIVRTVLSGGKTIDSSDAQFVTVEGDVSFSRGSTSDWKRAEQRGGLSNGDWVKTNNNASAELMFSNGSLYTVGPNALLEIYSQFNAQTQKKSNAIQVQSGPVEVATTDDSAMVRTPSTQVIVDSASTTQVGVSPEKQTAVVATKGTASVAPMTLKNGVAVPAGDAVKLESGQKIAATAEGNLSPVKKLLAPPVLTGPGDSQVMPSNTNVTFSWDPMVGAAKYLLQVSRSRIFSTQEINSTRAKSTAAAKVTDEGTFYWRVASIGADGDVGPFSSLRRFRVTSNVVADRSKNCPTPKLKLKAPYHVGSEFFIFEGDTDPGATVFVNDEEVDVDSAGHFKKLYSVKKVGQNIVVTKAVNTCGNQATENQTVIYDAE